MGRSSQFLAIPLVVTLAQTSSSVWSGTYTGAQADRGKPIYLKHCGRCHGDEAANPQNPLWGDRFAEHWEARSLADLFRRIRDTMPPGAEAPMVSAADKLDVMAFVLQQNGFPDGSAELTADDDALAAIQIASKDGVAPARTGTVVRVAGCLRQRSERDWQLTDATEPQRTTINAAANSRRQASGSEAGTRTIDLLNPFPDPSAHLGHNVAVTGFLVRRADGDAVNVVSLEMLAPACAR